MISLASTSELEALRTDWRRLAESAANPFVTPEWFDAATRETPERDQRVLVSRNTHGTIDAILPLVAEGDGSRRKLGFAGRVAGDEFRLLCGDPEREASLGAEFGLALGELAVDHSVVLDNVEVADADWLRGMLEGAGGSLRARAVRANSLPYLDLTEWTRWEDYLASRSRNFRSQIGRYERRLREAHEVVFRRTATVTELDRDFGEFMRLHLARRHTVGGSAADRPAVRSLHHEFARLALERGWLRLWLLEVDGRSVAGWYGFSIGGRYAYCLAGFDPAWESSRVGWLVLARSMRDAIEEGADVYDLLLGQEPYKQRLTSTQREVQTIVLARPRSAAAGLAAFEARGRQLAHRLPAERRATLKRLSRRLVDGLPGARNGP